MDVPPDYRNSECWEDRVSISERFQQACTGRGRQIYPRCPLCHQMFGEEKVNVIDKFSWLMFYNSIKNEKKKIKLYVTRVTFGPLMLCIMIAFLPHSP